MTPEEQKRYDRSMVSLFWLLVLAAVPTVITGWATIICWIIKLFR